MSEFYVRVTPSYAFSREHLSENGAFYDRLTHTLAASLSVMLRRKRYTFAFYSATADSRAACRKAFLDAWNAAFPEAKNAVRIHIALLSDNDDRTRLMDSAFTGYFGAEPYISLLTELYDSIPLLADHNSLGTIRAQNLLFAMDSGAGFTTLLSSFSDFCRRMGVFDGLTGDRRRFLELRVTPESEGKMGYMGVDEAIDRIFRETNTEEPDTGAIGLDISKFLDGDKTDDLRDFLRRLDPYQNDFLFIFRIPFLEKTALNRIRDLLSDVMLLRTVEIPPLDESALYEVFWDTLAESDYRPDASLPDVFFRRVAVEKKDGRFYGFKTARKIASEMILQKAAFDARRGDAGETVDRSVIAASDLYGEFAQASSETTGYDALREMIGMEAITERIREIVSQVKYSIRDNSVDRPSIHMRFLGAPGTGKTTVARIIGQIFREEGILRKGGFFEYTARQLCAEYVGQTAVKTAAICRDAYGSVLFIDEAYSLYEGDVPGRNDYGKEALTTLISEMENHRDDMLVIMAGYTDEMETLMKGNTGLRSRMPYAITFPSYTRDQLFAIFMLMVRKHFSHTPELETEAKTFFLSLSDEYVNSREFGNARFVRNLYERTWSKGALRSALAGEETVTLTREDFLAASAEKEFSEKLQQKKPSIGF